MIRSQFWAIEEPGELGSQVIDVPRTLGEHLGGGVDGFIAVLFEVQPHLGFGMIKVGVAGELGQGANVLEQSLGRVRRGGLAFELLEECDHRVFRSRRLSDHQSNSRIAISMSFGCRNVQRFKNQRQAHLDHVRRASSRTVEVRLALVDAYRKRNDIRKCHGP